MSSIEERAPLAPHMDRRELRALLAEAEVVQGRLMETLAEAVALLEPLSVPLGMADDVGAGGGAVWVVPVSEVPVDGSVELRSCPPAAGGRFGPWAHVIGEQERAVGGDTYRSFLIAGLVEPWTFHMDQCVQLRPFRPADEDLAEARHRAQTGGL